ncbi:GDSL family lipase [Nostocales cyanobacterium HT-58-2]|nr:GDSL family lipase [Nostocales cyanobacterium HT-58-2]
MKKEIVTAGFLLLSLTLPLKASAAIFSQFNVFGDSLSDTGNVFNLTGGLRNSTQAIPPSPPYFNGRFSNNKVWVDFVGEELGLTPTPITNLAVQLTTTLPNGTNYAFGGSNSGEDNAFVPGIPGVLAQVRSYTQPFLTSNQKVDPNGLYAIWGGANDYLFSQKTDVNQIVKNLSDSVELLAQAGAKNILVFNLPDLGKAPLVFGSENSSILTTLTNIHNAELATSVDQLSNKIPGVNIIPVDINSLVTRVLTNPREFGFKDVTNPCVVGNTIQGKIESVCDNPNDFLFFDTVHPTSPTHRLVANTVLAAIKPKSVPESSSALGLLALGALGGAAMLKRRQTQSTMTVVLNEIPSPQSSCTSVT